MPEKLASSFLQVIQVSRIINVVSDRAFGVRHSQLMNEDRGHVPAENNGDKVGRQSGSSPNRDPIAKFCFGPKFMKNIQVAKFCGEVMLPTWVGRKSLRW
jgi:hypothetical protein